MKRRIAVLALIVVGLLAPSMLNIASAAEKKYTIALIPGLTTDAFYITMHKAAGLGSTFDQERKAPKRI